MNEVEALESAGLSEKEAITYMDLRRHGESQTGKICRRTRLPSSYIYAILSSLMEKGLVNHKLINNIKVFRASEPDALERLFEEKEHDIRSQKARLFEFISRFRTVPAREERLTDFKYFEGLRGIKSLYAEITNSWKPGNEYCVASAPMESFRKLEGFFRDVVHKKRVKDRVRLRILINRNSRKWGMLREKMPRTEVRYLDIDTRAEYGILNEYFFLVSYGAEQYGLLIKDKNFADTFKVFFEFLWSQASQA